MAVLPPQILSQACRIFLESAYPEGPESIPVPRRVYWDISDDCDIEKFLPPAPLTRGISQILTGPHPGYAFRLGCSAFPFLRLTLQRLGGDGDTAWLCGVDTHDSWHHPEHPDAAAWLALQAANRELKSRIEKAWDAAGLLTLNRLLRQELRADAAARAFSGRK